MLGEQQSELTVHPLPLTEQHILVTKSQESKQQSVSFVQGMPVSTQGVQESSTE